MYTLIPTVYRALLNSALSGTDHRIHTTKKKGLTIFRFYLDDGQQLGEVGPQLLENVFH